MPTAGISDHAVAFYRDSDLAEMAGAHLLGAIKNDGVAVLVGTPDHRMRINAWLSLAGVDLAAARASKSYVTLDARDTMRGYMLNGWPDPAAFWRTLSPVLAGSGGRQGPVRVFGEMVSLLWEAGLENAAIDVEALWNELGSRYSFSLLCGYSAASVAAPAHADALAQVCSAHTSVLPAAV